jgi:hypothetical protein
MAAPIIFAVGGIGFMIGFGLFMTFVNMYILIWVLGEWEVIDSTWQSEFVGSLWGWTDEFALLSLFNDLLAIPFE